MREDKLTQSIEALTSCLERIYDNGCFFNKLVCQMAKLTEEIEKASYMMDRLAKELEGK